ncbi:exodeoxyribonuclease VII large subunit [Candidatus Saccharibacteria bacterium]|nr:exodeoxyribonuclease VII large subunit [Candidatus Saccharibacteria bacterium]
MNNQGASSDSFTPTEFISVVNQTLDYAYSSVLITGEVASYKVNQGKWVFFDIKDEESSISCFMPLWDLRMPLEDGMKVVVRGVPKVTKWGKFSFTVSVVKPVGEGSLKKAYELLKKKLTTEGVFDPAKKRSIPEDLTKLGIISSTGAAGYADFIKIINARWCGIKVSVAHTQVQGLDAPDQIIRALQYFNERGEVQMIAILRGGGSADDLSCFNDEALVRAIAASKIPVITGIGHEVDESLSDLAADVRASTPSNAAEMLTKDKTEVKDKILRSINRIAQITLQEIERARKNDLSRIGEAKRKTLEQIVLARQQNITQIKRAISLIKIKYLEPMIDANREKVRRCLEKIRTEFEKIDNNLRQKIKTLEVLNPEKVLSQGYAILTGKISPGSVVKITTRKQEIDAEVKKVAERKRNE